MVITPNHSVNADVCGHVAHPVDPWARAGYRDVKSITVDNEPI